MLRWGVGDIVYEIVVVGVGQLLRGLVFDFGKYERGEGRGLRGGRSGVFGQDCCVIGYARAL